MITLYHITQFCEVFCYLTVNNLRSYLFIYLVDWSIKENLGKMFFLLFSDCTEYANFVSNCHIK